MLNQELKVSPHGSFKVSQLCESVAICEALKEDRHNWDNATETEPAFLVYLGCNEAEISGYLKTALLHEWEIGQSRLSIRGEILL